MTPITERKCPRCHTVKSAAEFNHSMNTAHGLSPWCKICNRAYNKAARERDPEKYREYQRHQAEKHRENRQVYVARRKANLAQRRNDIRLEIRKHYGDACVCCGESDPRFLTLDHMNGKGADDRRRLGMGGVTFYEYLRRNGFPAGYQTLCFNCNAAKGVKDICPHANFDPMRLIGACG